MKQVHAVAQEREDAWIGDAVLGLYARRWILDRLGRMDAEMFTAMTSNHFLSTICNPTTLESRIGKRYNESGLEAAFAFIESEIIPRFIQQNRRRLLGLKV
jgi:hypothetical protein